MNKLKLVSFWVFVVAALSLGVFGYFYLRANHKPQVEALQLMPDSCVLYLRTASFHELENKINERNLIADKLKLFQAVNTLFLSLHHIDSLLQSSHVLQNELAESVFHLAFYPQKNWLLSTTLKELGKQGECLATLETLPQFSKQDKFYSFKFGAATCYLSLHDGVIGISNTTSLLQRMESAGGKLQNNPNFKQFSSTLSENKLLSVFCNQYLWHTAASDWSPALTALVQHGFFAVGVDTEPSALRINGFQAVDSSEVLASLLSQQSCGTYHLLSVLPHDTKWFKAYGLRDLKVLPESPTSFWNGINKNALYNVNLQWKESSGYLLASCGTAENKQVVVSGSNDTLRSDECLVAMSDSAWALGSQTIYRLAGGKALALFTPFVPEPVRYACRIGENVYYSADVTEIESTAAACAKGHFMSFNEEFTRYMQQNMPEQFHFLLYSAPNQKEHVGLEFLKLQAPVNAQPYEQFRHLSYALLGEGKYFKARFHLQQESAGKEKKLLWTTALDTTCSMQPILFINHNTNEHELIVQDDKLQLYLINAKGNVLWKKAIGEKIRSTVHRVDIYKNGKLQLLFNTEHKIVLLDRNGNDLPNFPIQLSSPATAPISVFDYDANKEYRIFVACANKTIYNYSLDGKKVDGFVPVKLEDTVTLPIDYVTVGESQYLIAIDVEGKIYTFSRRGVGRIGLRNRTTVSCKSFFVDAGNAPSSTYLVYVDDANGLLCKISFADIKSIVKLNSSTVNAHVEFGQFDENRSTDLLVSAENAVAAFDFSGNLLFEKTLENKLSESTYLGGDSYSLLVCYSKEAGTLSVMDLLRSKDMHIAATAPALIDALFKDNKQYLLVVNGKELSCMPLH